MKQPIRYLRRFMSIAKSMPLAMPCRVASTSQMNSVTVAAMPGAR